MPDWREQEATGLRSDDAEVDTVGSVIVGGARTPIGRLLGGLKDLSATDLGGVAIAAALGRAGLDA